jgi:hypothetical protein
MKLTSIKGAAQAYASMASSFNIEEAFEAGAEWAVQRAIEVVNDYKDELVKDMDDQEHWDTFSIEILDTATTKIDEIQK